MEISAYLRALVDNDGDHTVICDTEHRIIYMNKAAVKRYEKWGGAELIGKSVLDCHNEKSRDMIIKTLDGFRNGSCGDKVFTYYNEKKDYDVYIVALRDENGALIGYYEKHERRTREGEK